MKTILFALAITATVAASAEAQQYTRVYSVEQSSLVASSSGVAASYYMPSGQAYTAYGVPTTTYYPPSPPTAYTTFYAPGGPYVLTGPPCTQPRNRLSGFSGW